VASSTYEASVGHRGVGRVKKLRRSKETYSATAMRAIKPLGLRRDGERARPPPLRPSV